MLVYNPVIVRIAKGPREEIQAGQAGREAVLLTRTASNGEGKFPEEQYVFTLGATNVQHKSRAPKAEHFRFHLSPVS